MTIQSVKAVALLLLCLSAVVGLAVTYESVDAAGGFATDEGPTGPTNTIEGSEESSSISDPDDDSNPQLPLFFPTVDWMENTEDRSQITADGVFGGIAAVLIIGSLGLGVVTVYLTSGDGDQHEDTPDEPAAEIPIGEGVNSRSISPIERNLRYLVGPRSTDQPTTVQNPVGSRRTQCRPWLPTRSRIRVN